MISTIDGNQHRKCPNKFSFYHLLRTSCIDSAGGLRVVCSQDLCMKSFTHSLFPIVYIIVVNYIENNSVISDNTLKLSEHTH